MFLAGALVASTRKEKYQGIESVQGDHQSNTRVTCGDEWTGRGIESMLHACISPTGPPFQIHARGLGDHRARDARARQFRPGYKMNYSVARLIVLYIYIYILKINTCAW